MTRWNVVLLLALLVSCVWLVRVSYESRRLYAALDRAQNEERRQGSERERLVTELRGQATPLRIEKTARDRLAMRPATPALTQYVELPRSGAAGVELPRAAASAGSPPPPAAASGARR